MGLSPLPPPHRSLLIHQLLQYYGLLDQFDVVISKPDLVPWRQFSSYHGKDYLKILFAECWNKTLSNELHQEEPFKDVYGISKGELFSRYRSVESQQEDYTEVEEKLLKQYRLNGDCPIFSYLPLYLSVQMSCTLSLVPYIVKSIQSTGVKRSICINWDGGRHHALKNKASGYCYLNDIVLLIQQLRKRQVAKISYVDFDLHYSDGVTNAFQYVKSVQTISVHQHEVGFFPTGGGVHPLSDLYNIVNLPTKHGLDDEMLEFLTKEIIIPRLQQFQPDTIIIQCGGDGLCGDPFQEWQLTVDGFIRCVLAVIDCSPTVPIVLLGGGGYNEVVLAELYTHLTRQLLLRYSPGREVSTTPRTLAEPWEIDWREIDDPLVYKLWAENAVGARLEKPHCTNKNTWQSLQELHSRYENAQRQQGKTTKKE